MRPMTMLPAGILSLVAVPALADIRVAKARAGAVRRFLLSKGVRADAIQVGTREKAFTLFGLLPSDQDDDRRVYVTHD